MGLGDLKRWMARPRVWEREIRRFERIDRAHPPAPSAILFTGSSSIRFWSTLAADMRPLYVLNRGFGGAHAEHVTYFADRIVYTRAPRAIVLYAGDNDLGRLSPRSVSGVVEDFEDFVAAMRERLGAELPIYLLSIKPTPLRASQWPRMERANQGLVALAARDPHLHYVDVATPMLDGHGRARRELFRWDGLHLNGAGYALWTSIVRPRLLADFGEEAHL
ncbi:MAG: hypothetical protein IPK07_32495 [Deltaproteobacteria bacterium]|nr:hypothetical protein [Deltaproteobacteria bacterium]